MRGEASGVRRQGSEAAGEQEQEMQRHVRSRICRFGGCCTAGLNCPWWHSDEEIRIFEDERELKKRKLVVRCGFCARGECRDGLNCQRTQRATEATWEESETGVFGSRSRLDEKIFEFGEQTETATECGSCCSDGAAGGGCGSENSAASAVVDEEGETFERWRDGVARREMVLEEPDSIGEAGAFGALAQEEEVEVEDLVNFTFLPPKPKPKEKTTEQQQMTAELAAEEAENTAAEGGTGAAEMTEAEKAADF